MRRHWGMAALLVLTGCARGGGGDDRVARSDLHPSFGPDAAGGLSATVAPGSPSTSAPGGQTTTTTGGTAPRPPAQIPAPVVGGATTAAIVDRVGDLTPTPADPPPPWADLTGATLIRRADGFELRVRLGGDAAPSTTDADHTMNVASFYDVNGDGSIDFEVWANLAARGWGSSYFDNVKRRAFFNDKSGVTVAAEGGEVVLRFPLSKLVHADQFRWALASEWGRYDVLGTVGTARDDAPDHDASARFPG